MILLVTCLLESALAGWLFTNMITDMNTDFDSGVRRATWNLCLRNLNLGPGGGGSTQAQKVGGS